MVGRLTHLNAGFHFGIKCLIFVCAMAIKPYIHRMNCLSSEFYPFKMSRSHRNYYNIQLKVTVYGRIRCSAFTLSRVVVITINYCYKVQVFNNSVLYYVLLTILTVFQVLVSERGVQEERSSSPLECNNHHSCDDTKREEIPSFDQEEYSYGEQPHPSISC